MSLFQCENCGGRENTALSLQGTKMFVDSLDWTGIESRKGMMLCSACAPTHFTYGEPDITELGTWHGEFPQLLLPKGEFKTNRVGNLEHIKSGRTDLKAFEIK